MRLRAFVIASLALAAAVGARAAPIALLTPVGFAPETDKRAEVRNECQLGAMLEKRVGDALHRANKGPGTTTSADGDVLRLTVTQIWGAGGNSWTGPKGLFVLAEILHDGHVEHSQEMHRTTLGGVFGAFKGICGFMDRNAESLGKDLVRWTRDPSYKPADAGPASASASEPASAPAAPASAASE